MSCVTANRLILNLRSSALLPGPDTQLSLPTTAHRDDNEGAEEAECSWQMDSGPDAGAYQLDRLRSLRVERKR